MESEFLRYGIQSTLRFKNKICTMERTTSYCAIEGDYGYKWPTLSELYFLLFDTSFKETHNAEADVEATANCFWELKKRGIL